MQSSGETGLAPTDEIAIIRQVQSYLDEATALAADHASMAVVRAVSAFEIFLRKAFLDPYLKRGLFDDDELAELVSKALLGDWRSWRERVPAILWTCWRIDVRAMPAWRTMGQAWRLRNEIVHEGAECSTSDATAHVSAVRRVIEVLLIARITARSGAAEVSEH